MKKLTISLSLVLLLMVALGVGIYFFFGKNTKIIQPAKTPQQTTYTDPVSKFSLEIPGQYKIEPQTVEEGFKEKGVNRSCLTLKTDSVCLANLSFIPNFGKGTLESEMKHVSFLPTKTTLGVLPAATWQEKAIIHYLVVTDKTMFQASFDQKDNELIKSVLNTLKI
jgi:hypothetical protein